MGSNFRICFYKHFRLYWARAVYPLWARSQMVVHIYSHFYCVPIERETNKHLHNRHSIYYYPITIKIYTLFNLLLYLAIELSHIYSVCPVCWQYRLYISIHSSTTHRLLPPSSPDSFNILCTRYSLALSRSFYSMFTISIDGWLFQMHTFFRYYMLCSMPHRSNFVVRFRRRFFLIARTATTVTSLNNYPKALSHIPIK